MKKFISSILVASFIFATCAMNVMAANTRTMTVQASKTENLEAGDKITVEVVLDKDVDLISAGYWLIFDENVFSIDTASGGFGKPAKYIDSTWFSEIKNSNADAGGRWGVLFGTPTYNQTSSSISFAWAGSAAIPSGYDATNYVIGKFYLTVKEGVDVSSSTLSLTTNTEQTWSTTCISNETTGDTLTTVPATVTFKSDEPTVTPWDVTITAQSPAADKPAYTGYIWEVATTKGSGELTQFDVTFKDAAEETFERSILSATKDAYNWNAPTSFYVGLYTKRTGVTATWDIAAKDGETPVTVNKTIK